MIHETLAALTVPIDTLRPYARNPRNGDTDAIARSLSRNGQYRPVVVNKRTGEILAGNHTYAAAMELGWTEIAATFVDVDEADAARIVLADNKTADLGRYDLGLLADLVGEVESASLEDLESTGYTLDDARDLIARVSPPSSDPDAAISGLPDGDRPDATQMTFTLTLEQADLVRIALGMAKDEAPAGADTGNANSNGNALWLIVSEWIAARDGR